MAAGRAPVWIVLGVGNHELTAVRAMGTEEVMKIEHIKKLIFFRKNEIKRENSNDVRAL